MIQVIIQPTFGSAALSYLFMRMASLFVGLLLLSFTPGFAQNDPDTLLFTQEEREYLVKKEAISYCVDPDYMPFESINADGHHVGMSADFLEILARRGNIRFKLIPTKTWPEALQLAQERGCDVLPIASSSEKRRAFLNFTEPYVHVQAVVATLLEKPFFTSLEDVMDQKFAMVKGYSYTDNLYTMYPTIQLVLVNNYREGLELLQKGEIYGLMGNMATIGYSIQQSKMNNVKIAGRLELDVHLGLAIRNDDPILTSIMRKLILSLTETEKQAITNKWWSIRYEHPTDYVFVSQIIFALLTGIAAVVFWLTKVKQINARLLQVNSQLEDLNTQKDFYFSVIGHDLRNPFMAVMGYSSMLRTDVFRLEKEDIQKMVTVIHSRSGQVLDLLNQLLAWAQLESNRYKSEQNSIILAELVDQVLVLNDLNATKKKILIRNRVSNNARLKTDAQMLSAIIRNLISNAIKYSKENQEVIVGYEEERKVIWVSDEGIGMDQTMIKDIFSSKPKKSLAGTGKEQGTGLGLMICQRYAREINATLDVSSEPGEGTTFFVRFN